VTVIAVIDSLE